ncbi:MAG: hypothetical protein WB803_20490, partial [Pseudolabrys sp.]
GLRIEIVRDTGRQAAASYNKVRLAGSESLKAFAPLGFAQRLARQHKPVLRTRATLAYRKVLAGVGFRFNQAARNAFFFEKAAARVRP